MKKKFIPLILVLLTGCGLGHIEDTNGDDTRVATISDEKILGVSSHSSFMMISNRIQKKGVTTGSVKSSKFSGVKEIESFNKTNITYDLTITIKSGNFEVVVVSDSLIKNRVTAGDLCHYFFRDFYQSVSLYSISCRIYKVCFDISILLNYFLQRYKRRERNMNHVDSNHSSN